GVNGDAFIQLSREYAELAPVARAAEALRRLEREQEEAEMLLQDGSGDPELRALARDELMQLEERRPQLERELQMLLLPKDAADERNAILEVRAGTGGEEAALFAGDLLRMYQRHAEQHGWRFELLSYHPTDLGGVKEAVALVGGRGVFARLK